MYDLIPAQFWPLFKGTNGALSCCESIAIMQVAKMCPEGNYLEMGTFNGKSAMSALFGLKGENRFTLLEPKFDDEQFLSETINNINSAKRIFGSNVLNVYSPEYSTDYLEKTNDKYSYVFSDAGSHQDGLPMAEVKLLEDRIITGGIIAFHDWNSQFKEVREAYDYLVATGKYEEVPIGWDEIINTARKHNLEAGNCSWHHNELEFPCFVGAVRRK